MEVREGDSALLEVSTLNKMSRTFIAFVLVLSLSVSSLFTIITWITCVPEICFHQHTSTLEHVYLKQVKESLLICIQLHIGAQELAQDSGPCSSKKLRVPKSGARISANTRASQTDTV